MDQHRETELVKQCGVKRGDKLLAQSN